MVKSHADQKVISSIAGTGVMLLLSAAAILTLPIFILNEYLPAEYASVFVIISMGIIAFIGAVVAGWLTMEKKWTASVFAVLVYDIVLVFISVFFCDGLNAHVLYRILAGAIGCVCAILVLMLQTKSRSKRKKRRGNR